jgi:phosphoesterase RecJ-like protein
MNTLEEVVSAVQSHQRWVVTSHSRPDGDAVGSVLGCVQVLRAMGKQADGYLGDGVPFIYRDLPGAADIRTALVDPSLYDGVFIIECNSFARTQLEGISSLFSINIDHHESFAEFADINYVITSAAAASELVYHLAVAAGAAITPEIATSLYTAVLTDTGSFCYSGTSAQTFAFAREMVLAGADPAAISQQVYFSNPASKMHLLGRALSNLRIQGPISWMHVSEADMLTSGATEQDCEGLVNWALSIHGIEATAFFREIAGNRYRVSLRSKGRIDVAGIAEAFGGGGHACASGHAIDGPYEVATTRVLALLANALELGDAATRRLQPPSIDELGESSEQS